MELERQKCFRIPKPAVDHLDRPSDLSSIPPSCHRELSAPHPSHRHDGYDIIEGQLTRGAQFAVSATLSFHNVCNQFHSICAFR
ncbi:hypothetical protein Hypma_014470 [Hypsizygus marmoreus]|uniref:Uncharacterized protein n=1 Tax=Hypsizygus marmoreus TaxID=39966 RepID=A0A369JB13_HYPMA|nr:hypothetical protein Hypma_014470 [Hypsizygus marmoreus]